MIQFGLGILVGLGILAIITALAIWVVVLDEVRNPDDIWHRSRHKK